MRPGGIRGHRMAKMAVDHVFTEFLTLGDYSSLGRTDLELFENGGRVILPNSCLVKLMDLKIFDQGDREALHLRIHGPRAQIPAFVGVLDFDGREQMIYIPRWLQEYCGLSPGDTVCVIDARLPKGEFMKIEAQSTDFLEIEDAESVLTAVFPNFSCVSAGQYLRFSYAGKHYDIRILETLPERAVSLINTNISVDFAEPVGYKEYAERMRTLQRRQEGPVGSVVSAGRSSARSRPGRTLDGRASELPGSDDWGSGQSQTASRKDLGLPLGEALRGAGAEEPPARQPEPEERPNLDVRQAQRQERFQGKRRRL